VGLTALPGYVVWRQWESTFPFGCGRFGVVEGKVNKKLRWDRRTASRPRIIVAFARGAPPVLMGRLAKPHVRNRLNA